MSATHILNKENVVSCGAVFTRGYLTLAEFTKLRESGKLRQQMKARRNHVCSFRSNGKCYRDQGGKRIYADCTRRTEIVSAICSACSRMY